MTHQPPRPSLSSNLAQQLATPVAEAPPAAVTIQVPPDTTLTVVVSATRAKPE